MNYYQKANPNPTNSEMDSKTILKPRTTELTDSQRDKLTAQFAELVADNMDTKDLVRYAIDGMIEYFNEGSLDELKEEVDNFDEELYATLVEDILITDLMKEAV
tara:strand:+ start:729 stop:1040 length:312 start_codon:yes stop_codon:yes gene_type:complete